MAEAVRWFGADGWRLPWVEAGGERGPLVLALPGLSDGLGPLSEPRFARAAVAARDRTLPYRLVTLSHRHPVEPGTTTADLAAAVARFVEEVLGGPVVVLGHSMGGMVAQWLAVDHPHLVRALGLTATLARPDQAFTRTLRRWQGLVDTGAWRAFYAAADAASYTGRALARRRVLARLGRAPALDHLADRHRALTEACLAHDTTARLAEVACPTVVVAGARDPLVAPERSRELAAAVPGARFTLLGGLAHGFPEQAPARTVAALASLLDDPEGVA